ncbi:dolichyl-phosphate beta-D-mannosyltransferase [Arthrobacter crystallopoietes BAB-32]|uniref:Dolichyl-phosphate beta-D-mannosyltransferase n=1 Tax=Arthrobacter crystallopoietes BAB-32 TaxID=1246476 RepID=N1V6E9_9MICC|nr:polyprenol monophosphomannose synthase [Arthrobacter crystallopoietes]EMY35599.1 dolichyl-phosphate beta-D-mannosyltransferase [Arthrobacter crystallopoietes BAB-32]
MRVVTIIPTFNEIDSLPRTIARLRAAVPDSDVLVVDDNSPDGTGQLADSLAARDRAIHVLHRQGKEGLGAAYIAGFKWGLEAGYDVLVEMDADGSHQPEELQRLLSALDNGADMAKGSRWIRGGKVVNWPLHRKLLSLGGSLYSRILLGVGIKDITGGYNAFKSATLRRIDLDSVESVGYCFQIDLTWKTLKAGLTVREVPITFVEREFGDSKMSGNIVLESILLVTKWGLRSRWKALRGGNTSTRA